MTTKVSPPHLFFAQHPLRLKYKTNRHTSTTLMLWHWLGFSDLVGPGLQYREQRKVQYSRDKLWRREMKRTLENTKNSPSPPAATAEAVATTAACYFSPSPHGLCCHIAVIGDGCCSPPACLIERKTNCLLQIMGKVRRNTVNSQWSF